VAHFTVDAGVVGGSNFSFSFSVINVPATPVAIAAIAKAIQYIFLKLSQ